jgi:hypothetical protein
MSCKESVTESQNDDEQTYIEVKTLIPEVNTLISANDTIRAMLEYAIAEDIISDFGFSLSIKFDSKNEGETFSIGSDASIVLNEKKGTKSLEYPLNQIWSNENLKHPLGCYFYLHQMTSETASKVLARTPIINYSE